MCVSWLTQQYIEPLHLACFLGRPLKRERNTGILAVNLPEEQDGICLWEPRQVCAICITRLRRHVYLFRACVVLSRCMAEYLERLFQPQDGKVEAGDIEPIVQRKALSGTIGYLDGIPV